MGSTTPWFHTCRSQISYWSLELMFYDAYCSRWLTCTASVRTLCLRYAIFGNQTALWWERAIIHWLRTVTKVHITVHVKKIDVQWTEVLVVSLCSSRSWVIWCELSKSKFGDERFSPILSPEFNCASRVSANTFDVRISGVCGRKYQGIFTSFQPYIILPHNLNLMQCHASTW